jgi:hypothetical protein
MLALVAATPAKAGTASVSAEGTLSYVANPGETNTVTVTQNGGTFTVSDATADVSPGAGCVQGATTGVATCAGSIGAISVDLLDLNDFVDVNAQAPSTLNGRLGDDELVAGDGVDFVHGGPGSDTINVRDSARDSVQCDAGDTVASDPADIVGGGCPNNVAPVAKIDGGPAGPTNDTTPVFTFSSPETDVTGFQCRIDGFDDAVFGCTSGDPQPQLGDGPYFFRVRALDNVPGAGPWVGQSFRVDTQAPQLNIAGPVVSTTAQPTYEISSNETAMLECALDQGEFAVCNSPYTTPPLANGTHVLHVRGTDQAGNITTTEATFSVQVTPGSGGGGGTLKPKTIIIDSLVLISGRPVKMSRKGVVSIRLQCAGSKTCKGRMSITTAEPVKRKSRKLETLGSKRFSIAANKKKNVKVRFSKSKRRLAKRLKRFKAKVVIREIDQRGNARISSRVFILRAR